MSRPITGQALILTGIVLALYPRNLEQGLEIQRAPDNVGDPDVGNALVVGTVTAGTTTFTDPLPLDATTRHYRSRHRQGNALSAWTGWVNDTPAIIPDPLPPVPSLIPKIEVIQTVAATSVSFVATAQLGELNFGHVEFQDPGRTFVGDGAINNGDKTLTITGGDLTDEDVNLYVSVADAGVAGALLETRIDSVTNATTCELETAASANVNNKDVIIGGGWFSDFDFDASDEAQETNTRNRPNTDSDVTWIMFRAVTESDVSSPTLINLNPQVEPKLLSLTLSVHDDQGVSGDDQYTFTWTVSSTVTDAMSIDLEGGKEDDRGAVLTSGTEGSPASNLSKQIDDGGEADGLAVPEHWGRAILKESGNPISQLEVFEIIPTL